jgi:hypothetical protein
VVEGSTRYEVEVDIQSHYCLQEPLEILMYNIN